MAKREGWYLYGVSETGATKSGLPEGVFTIRVGKVEALVKKVSLDEFGEEALQRNLKDPKWLERQLWEHERVLETVMQHTTVLPMKFGTIFTSSERLFHRLDVHELQLLKLLEELAGQEEWGVKGFCDRSRVEGRVKQESAKVKALEAQLAARPAGTAYLLKKKLAELLREEIDWAISKETGAIYEELRSFATQAALNQPLGRGFTELTGKQGEMILNAAFLLPKARVSEFAEAVERLKEAHRSQGLELERVGPFPPYNFSVLPLKDEEEALAHE